MTSILQGLWSYWNIIFKIIIIIISHFELLVNTNLYSQNVSEHQLISISNDFKTSVDLRLEKRNKHFHIQKNTKGDFEFYMDSIDPCLFFNNRNKSEILDWLGPPDSVFQNSNVDFYLYRISAVNKDCKLHFSFGIPKPFPKSMPKQNKGDVNFIEFICIYNCLEPIEIEEMNIKYLKIGFISQ